MTARRSMWGLGLATALIAPAVAVAAPTTTQYTDLDDFSQNPAYAKFYQQTITFNADTCGEWNKARTIECARIKAPLDWNDPSKGTLDVAIGRKAGTSSEGKRLFLANPGGPGSGGITFGALLPSALLGLDGHYGVGIDPRGTGDSTRLRANRPTIVNQADYRADGDSRTYTKAGLDAAIENLKNYNAAISEQPLTPYINTVQTARDFNLVRALLGYQQADYYGGSYGTTLGSTMAKMFPNRFDRVVLDSNTDWAHPNLVGLLDQQIAGIQAAFDRFFLPFLARHHDRYGLGTTTVSVNRSYELVRAKLTDPTIGKSAANRLDDMLRTAMYSHFAYDRAGQMLRELNQALSQGGKPAELTAIVNKWWDQLEGPDTPVASLNAVYSAVNCNDYATTQDVWSEIRRREVNVRQRPLAGAEFLLHDCVGWTSPTGQISPDIVNRPVKQALMLQQEGDPATAYTGAYATWSSQPRQNVRMVNVDDYPGHGLAWYDTPCAAAPFFAYLRDGKFPTSDVACQAQPWKTWTYPFQGEFITDTQVFEALNPGTATSFPKPDLYVMRDLSELRPDASTPTPAPSGKVGPAGTSVRPLSPEGLKLLEDIRRQQAKAGSPRF